MAGLTYLDKIKAIQPDDLSGVWATTDTLKPLAADGKGRMFDGRYRSGVSLQNYEFDTGEKIARYKNGYVDLPIQTAIVPNYNGVTSFTDIFSPALASAFSPSTTTTKFSINIWMKIDTPTWNDGAFRRAISLGSPTDHVFIRKLNTLNDIQVVLLAGGVPSFTGAIDLGGKTDWIMLTLTVDLDAGSMSFFADTVLKQTVGGLGTWGTSLVTLWNEIGAITGAANPFNGNQQFV